jgi:hypothetical protein
MGYDRLKPVGTNDDLLLFGSIKGTSGPHRREDLVIISSDYVRMSSLLPETKSAYQNLLRSIFLGREWPSLRL